MKKKDYLSRKRQNYEGNDIFWKIKEIMKHVSKLQQISLKLKYIK
jgi:hypothetical protein